MTRRDKALTVFKSLNNEINSLNNMDDFSHYYQRMMEAIRLYWGKDSIFYTNAHNTWLGSFYDRDLAKKFTETIIKHIEQSGIPPNKNFIESFSNTQLISWATGIAVTLCSGGYFVGSFITSNKIDKDALTLQIKYEQVKSSLLHLSDSIANQNAAKKNNKDAPKKQDSIH